MRPAIWCDCENLTPCNPRSLRRHCLKALWSWCASTVIFSCIFLFFFCSIFLFYRLSLVTVTKSYKSYSYRLPLCTFLSRPGGENLIAEPRTSCFREKKKKRKLTQLPTPFSDQAARSFKPLATPGQAHSTPQQHLRRKGWILRIRSKTHEQGTFTCSVVVWGRQ